jgi:hypothetical protein
MNAKTLLAKRLKFALLIVCCLAFSAAGVEAQTVLVNYSFNNATGGTTCNPGAYNSPPGVTATLTTSRTCATSSGVATTPTAFTQNQTAGSSISIDGFSANTTQYFQFQLSGVQAYANYQVYFQANTGNSINSPTTVTLQYSTDGQSFTNFQSAALNRDTFTAYFFDLSAVPDLNYQQTIYFRIVGSGGTNGNTILRIDNFQVQALTAVISAANLSIGGRVSNSNGRGIRNVRVVLTGGNLTQPVYTQTTPFGFYRFDGLDAGQTYVVTVFSKSYYFGESSRVITLHDNVADADFVAEGLMRFENRLIGKGGY